MKLNVDPTVDVIFKVVFGSEDSAAQLRSFLNAALGLKGEHRIAKLAIKSPLNLQEFEDSKLSIVDIKAEDLLGRTFVVEMQVGSQVGILQRMLYGGITVSYGLIESGDDYKELTPVISLWIVTSDLPPMLQYMAGFPLLEGECEERLVDVRHQSKAPHLAFGMYDRVNQCYLCEHLSIHVIQLKRAINRDKIVSEKDQWLYYLKYGKELDPEDLPDFITLPEIHQAMKRVETFMSDAEARHLYEKRRDVQMAMKTQENAFQEVQRRLAQETKARMHEAEGRKRAEAKAVEQAEARKRAEAKAVEQAEARKRAEAKAVEEAEARKKAEAEVERLKALRETEKS